MDAIKVDLYKRKNISWICFDNKHDGLYKDDGRVQSITEVRIRDGYYDDAGPRKQK